MINIPETAAAFKKRADKESLAHANKNFLKTAFKSMLIVLPVALIVNSCLPDYADAASANPIVECDELLKGRYVAHRGQGLTDAEFTKVMLEDLVYKGENPVKACLIDLEKHPVHLSSWKGGKGYAFARVGGYIARYTPESGIK